MKKILLTLFLLILFLLSGCQTTDDERNPEPTAKAKNMRFRFTLPGSNVLTKGIPAEAGENKINDLALLFFEPTTNGRGKLIDYHQVPIEEIPEEEEMEGEEQNEFELDIEFNDWSKLTKTEAYSILVVANLEGNLNMNPGDFFTSVSDMNENDVIQFAMLEIEGVGTSVDDQGNNSKAIRSNNLPMSARITKTANEEVVECRLIRAVARFDVINNASGYRLVSASVWNAYTNSAVWDDAVIDYTYPRTKRFYGLRDYDGYDEMYGGLYAFENVSTNPDNKDQTTTCLILGLQPATSGRGEDISYYRVNISPQQTGQYLKRNNVYQVTIAGVNGTGAGNEYDAYSSGKLLLDTGINSWDRDEDGLILRDGDNLLALPTTKAAFGPEAEDRQYYVYTLGTGTVELYYLDMPSGMEARLQGNNLFISVTSFSQQQRKGSVEIRFAGMKGVIEIVQTGQTEKYLTLSYTNLPTWPAGIIADRVATPIVINSSGPWTAEIYNGYFSFDLNNEVTIQQGIDGGSITNIYNTSINDGIKPRTSFVLVSLDDDPENYRNVFVLTQAGLGGFIITPSPGTVYFNADGTLEEIASGNYNVFTVNPGDEQDTWRVEITPKAGTGENEFRVEYDESNNREGTFMKGSGMFTLLCSEDINYSDNFLTATAKVIHNENNSKSIELEKDYYYFSTVPTSANIPASGGTTSRIQIRTNLPDPVFNVSISSNLDPQKGLIPYLVDQEDNLTEILENQTPDSYIKVKMPGIDQYLPEAPVAYLTFEVEGTPLTTIHTVSQNAIEYVDIIAHNIKRNDYGSWIGLYSSHFNKWAEEMGNSSNFGPLANSTVHTKSAINYQRADESSISDDVRIININHVISATQPGKIQWDKFRNNSNVVFVISTHEVYSSLVFTIPGFSGYEVTTRNQVAGKTSTVDNPRTIYENAKTMNPGLWDYLFINGPFGAVNPASVKLYPGDNLYASLITWPTHTFVPLILNPGNNIDALVGIDPVNRIIWIGDTELFSKRSSATEWGENSETGRANLTFLRNLIAWMVNVNNYGDLFTKRFIVDE